MKPGAYGERAVEVQDPPLIPDHGCIVALLTAEAVRIRYSTAFPALTMRAHSSRNVTVLLNTGRPGFESRLSATK